MLYMDDLESADCSAQDFLEAARHSNMLDKIRSIAIDECNHDFANHIDSLKKFPSLELVFVVLGGTIGARKIRAGEEDDRISEPQELMLKMIDTLFDRGLHKVPRINSLSSPSHHFEKFNSHILKDLHKRLARPDGITPPVRFVRAVPGKIIEDGDEEED